MCYKSNPLEIYTGPCAIIYLFLFFWRERNTIPANSTIASFTLNTVVQRTPPLPPLGQTTPLRRRQPPNTTAAFQQTATFQLSQRTKHHCARQHSSSCAVLWLHWLHEHHIIHRHNNCTFINDFTLVWAHYNTQTQQLHIIHRLTLVAWTVGHHIIHRHTTMEVQSI